MAETKHKTQLQNVKPPNENTYPTRGARTYRWLSDRPHDGSETAC